MDLDVMDLAAQLERAEKIGRTARRLVELAAVLAVAALAILVVDMVLKQQILRAAEEGSRGDDGGGSDQAGVGPDRAAVLPVADVGVPAELDESAGQAPGVPATVD